MTDEERRHEFISNLGRLMVLRDRVYAGTGRKASAVAIPAYMFPLKGPIQVLGLPVVCGERWGLVFDV